MWLKELVLVLYCCIKTYYELNGLKQHKLIRQQFLWAKSLGTAWLDPLLRVSLH